MGVLWGTSILRSKDPHINRLMMELALVFAPGGSSLECVHVWSEDNELADELSRMTAGSAVPPCLIGISRAAWSGAEPWRNV